MLSYQGLQALGLAHEALRTFPPEFSAGMAARAEHIGDTGASAPEGWDWIDGEVQQRVHALVSIYCPTGAGETAGEDPQLLEREVQKVRAEARAAGVEVVATQYARLPESREHFGFVDGISQPEVAVAGLDKRPGGGAWEAPEPRKRLLRKPLVPPPYWRPLRAGEFLLGREDEDDQVPPARSGVAGARWRLRRLPQAAPVCGAVPAPGQGAQRRPGHGPTGNGGGASRARPRWAAGHGERAGRPSPTRPRPPRHPCPGSRPRPRRPRCPPGAGPAASNSRPGNTTTSSSTRTRTGRGAPWAPTSGGPIRGTRACSTAPSSTATASSAGDPLGPPLPVGPPGRRSPRARMIFICMQASIEPAVRVPSRPVAERRRRLPPGRRRRRAGRGPRRGRQDDHPGPSARFVSALPRLVTVRGGEFFFLPSMRALRGLAGLPEPAQPPAAL